MITLIKTTLLLVVGLTVSGCAGTAFILDENSRIPNYNQKACVDAFSPDGKLKNDKGELFTKSNTPTKYKQILPGGVKALIKAGTDPTAANRILDCILVDFHSDDPSGLHGALPGLNLLSGESYKESEKIPVIDDNKIKAYGKYRQLQLYRAHVATALLASYGGYNVSGKLQDGGRVNKFTGYDEATDDANRILNAISTTVKALRSANTEAKNPNVQNVGSQVGIAYRARDITRLAVVIEAPTVQRGKVMVERIISAITGKSILQAKEAAKIALDGLKKAVIMTTIGNAWLADARLDLRQHFAKFVADINAAPSDDAWKYWDAKIESACSLIGAFGSTNVSCVPET